MKTDIEKWVEKCIMCCRFRKMPKKQLSQAVIPVDADCWDEVLIDFEGPFQPADKDGNHYNYICVLCVLLYFWMRFQSATVTMLEERLPAVFFAVEDSLTFVVVTGALSSRMP